MKKTRIITTTVNVAPSNEVFVPKVGEVPNESAIEKLRRQNREHFRRFYYACEENRKRNIQGVIERRKRRRERQKGTA